MNNNIITFYLFLLLHPIQIYCMDKDTGSKCTLFSNAILNKKTNQYFIIFSKVQTPVSCNLLDCKVIKYKIHNSFLLWSRIEASSYDQLNISNSLLLGVDIINRNDPNNHVHKNIERKNAIIVSKKQLLIGVGLMFSLYFLRKT